MKKKEVDLMNEALRSNKLPQTTPEPTIYDTDTEPIHLWFELSYAKYLTVPRSIMEAMPIEWQRKVANLLSELDHTYDWRPKEGRYWVQLKDGKGRYTDDPLMQYRHPDDNYIKSIKKEAQ